jgi:hypothetical protein
MHLIDEDTLRIFWHDMLTVRHDMASATRHHLAWCLGSTTGIRPHTLTSKTRAGLDFMKVQEVRIFRLTNGQLIAYLSYAKLKHGVSVARRCDERLAIKVR